MNLGQGENPRGNGEWETTESMFLHGCPDRQGWDHLGGSGLPSERVHVFACKQLAPSVPVPNSCQTERCPTSAFTSVPFLGPDAGFPAVGKHWRFYGLARVRLFYFTTRSWTLAGSLLQTDSAPVQEKKNNGLCSRKAGEYSSSWSVLPLAYSGGSSSKKTYLYSTVYILEKTFYYNSIISQKSGGKKHLVSVINESLILNSLNYKSEHS